MYLHTGGARCGVEVTDNSRGHTNVLNRNRDVPSIKIYTDMTADIL